MSSTPEPEQPELGIPSSNPNTNIELNVNEKIPLSPKTSKQIVYADNPELTANWISLAFWSYISPLLSIGNKRQLNDEDMYTLNQRESCKVVMDAFLPYWKLEAERDHPSIFRACWKAFGTYYIISGILKLISDILVVSAPFLVREFLAVLADPGRSNTEGYIIIAILAGFYYTSTMILQTHYIMIIRTGDWVKTIICNLIYQKALRIASTSKTGRIMNMYAADTFAISFLIEFFHYAWSSPFMIICILIALFTILGPAVAAGIALFICGIVVNAYLAKILSKIKEKMLEFADVRIKLATEMIEGIRIVKFFSLESVFIQKIQNVREKELVQLRRTVKYAAASSAIFLVVPFWTGVLTFFIFILLGNDLTPEIAFSALIFFNLLTTSLLLLPRVILSFLNARVSYKRIQEFLTTTEVDPTSRLPYNDPNDGILSFDNASFAWPESIDPDSTPDSTPSNSVEITSSSSTPDQETEMSNLVPLPTLRNLTFSIPKGSFVIIVGKVGSGKSSILSAILGEIPLVDGSKALRGTTSYMPQIPWIFSGTVRENVLFNSKYEEKRYRECVSACALDPDLQLLAAGDQTEIGEAGINLSGGQKARLALARACFNDSEILLLDDPLSAVDVHVGSHIVNECLLKFCKNRTRILVTHQLQYLPLVDYVLLMENGQVSGFGTPKTLEGSSSLLRISSQVAEEKAALEKKIAEEEELLKENEIKQQKTKKAIEFTGSILIQKETRSAGSVDLGVVKSYIRSGGGMAKASAIPFFFAFAAICHVLANYSLSYYVDNLGTKNELTSDQFLYLYCGLSFLSGSVVYFRAIILGNFCVVASKTLFTSMIENLLHCPTNWFDVTPVGRIINRVTKDVDSVDRVLPSELAPFWSIGISLIAMLAVVIAVSLPTLVVLIPLTFLYYKVQKYYRKSSIEVRRITDVAKSPLYANVAETLNGLDTIRAFGQSKTLEKKNSQLINQMNQPYWVGLNLNRWLGVRLGLIGPTIVFAIGISSLLFRETLTAGTAGLAFSYVISSTFALNWFIRMLISCENEFNCVERIVEYSELPSEGAHHTDIKVPEDWPSKGAVEIKNLVFKYRPDLPPSLENVNLSIPPGSSVGIVGRTGSGKSTLLKALFRVNEPTSGSILIDGIDISTIGLSDLRSNIAIVPQEPVLFEGTIRSNLDIAGVHTDDQIWAALKKVEIMPLVESHSSGLDYFVEKNGANFSVGERQLLCFARSLMGKSTVVVLDEATAAVDKESDEKIQKIIRTSLKGSTLLIIAHRLQTIIDMDYVLVMSNGKVDEFDHPWKLLSNPNSSFSSMVDETGLEAEHLRQIAVEAGQNYGS